MNTEEMIELLEIVKICSDYNKQRKDLHIPLWPNHWTVKIDNAINELKTKTNL